ncbi:MAG: adenylyl-sulfate kinase [Trueperaceae bacterium]
MSVKTVEEDQQSIAGNAGAAGSATRAAVAEKATNLTWHDHGVTKGERARRKGQKPCILWFTGFSGSGKSTIANAVEVKLAEMGYHTYLLDGDNIRHGLNKDLGFSDEDRTENIRRIGEAAKLFVDAGMIVLTAFISPFRSDRTLVREIVEEDEFLEIFVDTPLSVCEERDPKGLYAKARRGEIKDFTGLDSPYEAPDHPEVHLRPAEESVEQSVDRIVRGLEERGVLPSG